MCCASSQTRPMDLTVSSLTDSTALPPLFPEFSHTKRKTVALSMSGLIKVCLVKAGDQVTVSVRRAVGGTDLGQLKDAVARDFLKLDEQERNVRTAVAKMESGLMGRLAEFEYDR